MLNRLQGCLAKKKTKEELDAHYNQMEQVELEKGDLPAMLIAAFISLGLPVLLFLGAVYTLIYFSFLR